MTTKGEILRKIDTATLGLFAANTYEFNMRRAETSTVWVFNTHATATLNYRVDLAPGTDGATNDEGNWLWQEKEASNPITAGAAGESVDITEGWAMQGRVQIEDASVHADAIVTCASVLEDDTVTVNGLLYTAVDGTPADFTEFDMSGNDTATGDSLEAALIGDARTGVTAPLEDVTASNTTGTVTVTSLKGGDEGNAIDISSSNGSRLAITGDTAGFLNGGTDLHSSFHLFVVNSGTW